GKLAQPLTTIEAHNLINQIEPLIEKYHPDTLVIGEPDPGPVRDLAIVLKDEVGRFYKGRIILHPEDLSSQEAAKKMLEGGIAKQKRQKDEHAAAAAVILQDYLDTQP
ncbi:MAG: RuvX/YqgF family protein, partial [Microgenomates group bacterium]